MNYKCTNAYYFGHLNKIGGIESHLYYVAKKYKDIDMVVYYRSCHETQLERLKSVVRCVHLEDYDSVECVNLFCCFNRDILDHCKAKKKYLVLHGDYKNMVERGQLDVSRLPVDPRIDEYLGVSQLVCDSWFELTGIQARCVYEPVVLDKVERPLMFISATRLTPEKGWHRMEKLAMELDKANVNYLWLIYTDSKKSPTKNMVFCEPRLDITDKLGGFDAFIQLSDNEGYCLSVVEAMMRKIPVICTDLPVLKELGLDDSNSIRLDFSMENIPIEEIKNIRKKRVKFAQIEDKWGDVLDKSPRIEQKIKVTAGNGYVNRRLIDSQLNRVPQPGEQWYVDYYRYEDLIAYQTKQRIQLIVRAE